MTDSRTVQFITGDKITFIKTTEETEGEYLHVRVELPPKKGNGLHSHPSYEEEFLCISGQLEITLGKEVLSLNPGESATAPKHAPHKFRNQTDEPVIFEVITKPPRNQEAFWRIIDALRKDGKTFKNGIPKNIWHIIYLLDLFETYPVIVPSSVQKMIISPLKKSS